MEPSIVWRGARWGSAVSLGMVLTLSACGGGSGGSEDAGDQEAEGAGATTVDIVNFLFEPQEAQVSPGTKVIWVNQDSAPHNIQDLSDLNIPISRDLPQNFKFSIRYEEPGTYPYVCALHPWMTGTVKVV